MIKSLQYWKFIMSKIILTALTTKWNMPVYRVSKFINSFPDILWKISLQQYLKSKDMDIVLPIRVHFTDRWKDQSTNSITNCEIRTVIYSEILGGAVYHNLHIISMYQYLHFNSLWTVSNTIKAIMKLHTDIDIYSVRTYKNVKKYQNYQLSHYVYSVRQFHLKITCLRPWPNKDMCTKCVYIYMDKYSFSQCVYRDTP